MEPKRVLIVEPDNAFALSLAAIFHEDGVHTRVASSAAEAEIEIATRRPDLCLVRAELSDLSGFSLCARLRHDPATARLAIVLYSSDTPPESLAEHARTAWAASGYLAMPLDTDALRKLAANLLAREEPVESADDAVILDDVEEAPPEAGAAPPEEAAPSPPPGEAPPPVPQRPRRAALTDEDRLFADRVFQSISERRDELVAESHRRRPPPRRDLLQSPEGRLQLLRDDLKVREAQIARLAEIWEVRERELSSFDERIHDRDVELQGLKVQVDDLLRRLAEARDLFVTKEREYGASIDGLLLEKFGQEKELIEVVASNERRIHELERELRRREDDLAHRKIALDEAREEIARLDRQSRAEASRLEERERELGEELSRRADELADAEEALAASRREGEEATREARLRH
ncbi:MAG TPA: response regulator, partial [Anaeromyxobacter sp.]